MHRPLDYNEAASWALGRSTAGERRNWIGNESPRSCLFPHVSKPRVPQRTWKSVSVLIYAPLGVYSWVLHEGRYA